MAISFAVTIVMYLLTMFYLPNYINVSYIFNLDCMIKIVSVTAIAWLPFFIGGKLFITKNELGN